MKIDDEVNNTEHSLVHCPVAKFIWDLTGDLIRIIIGRSINIDVTLAFFNFYTIKRDMENKRKRVIYILFHREDELVNNDIISYEFIKNIRLSLKFRRICSVFLNHYVNDWQWRIPIKTIMIFKK